jgi:tetratricopeptide (TPR) repeat protein
MAKVSVRGAPPRVGKTAKPVHPLMETRERLVEAERLRVSGQLDRARAICEPLVVRYGDYFGALHTLGLIYADKGNYQMALGFLVRAAMFKPRSWTTLTALSGVYLQLDAREMAAHTLEQARLIKPRDASVLLTLGEIYVKEREYELAENTYREVLALEPSLEGAALGLGDCCTHLGQYAEAANLFEGFLKRGIQSLDLLFALKQVPQSVVSVDVLELVGKVVREQGQDKADFETSVAFIRAAFLDKAGRPEEAWKHLVPAARTLFNREAARNLSETQHASLTWLRENPTKARGGNGGGGQPISLFILGPSRSGKTSMETLLGTLDGVKRGYENPIVENAVRQAFQSAGFFNTAYFAALPPQFYSLCRDIYLDELARRAGSARVFTNTHPAHIHHAGRIAATFPNVRFIFVKRNLEDNALRIYMRKYRWGSPYSYDLKSTYEYIIWYHQMMDLIAEHLPDRVRIIHYEEMIADPAGALRVAADLCGLAMRDGPLPELGDDRGCAAPYREFMAAASKS